MRKIEFRKQVTGYDCAPTCFINALVYLFNRKEIPNEIVQGIYLKTIGDSKGTSDKEVELLCNWLSNYNKNEGFAVKAVYKDGNDVDFDKLKKHVRKTNCCAIASVKSGKKSWHYIAIFRYEKGYFYCFDPFYENKHKEEKQGKELWSLETYDECNLRISIDFLKKAGKERYQSGEKNSRVCVLIKRISK